MKQTFTSFIVALSLLVLLSTAPALTGPNRVFAQSQDAQPETRRVPAIRSQVYEQFARAQEHADGGEVQEALSILDNVNDKRHSMNSYEIAMMYNFYGFINYNADRIDAAIESFENVVAQESIPLSFEKTTVYSLAQLHMAQGNYDKTVAFLERWEALNDGEVPIKNLVLKAQAMYQKKDYQQAGDYINEVIQQVEAEGEVPEENWYVLQRAVYYELKQPEKVAEVLVKMLKHYNDPKYWTQLAGMYGELGQEKKQLAMMETAYQQGFVNSGSDLFNLAQLYYYHQVPYKGARVMEEALDSGKLERNFRNLRFLSQCWTAAQETEKAIPVMSAAADMSEDGELNAQLAQIYLNDEQWDNAIVEAEEALAKGGLRNPGLAHLVIGMAEFNRGNYAVALNALAEAEKFDSSQRMAEQWSKYVESEKQSAERIAAELSS